jgi:transcriptional regulator with XRE-family HTH domain
MAEGNCFGSELRTRRELLGLSIKRLSQLSGVSSRWIVCAEKSKNISVDVLKKLMQALGLNAIKICPGMTIEAGLTAPDTTALVTAFDEIGRSVELAKQAADRIRTFTAMAESPLPER